jgi:hypothetical protein
MIVVERPNGKLEEISFLRMWWHEHSGQIEYLPIGAEKGIATQFAIS